MHHLHNWLWELQKVLVLGMSKNVQHAVTQIQYLFPIQI
jgi:hypothetical protein